MSFKKISIVGLGYVGLPLALEFAKAGLIVHGIEQNPKKVEMVNKGISYIDDVKNDELLEVVNKGNLKAFIDFEPVKDSDAIIICVPTPLGPHKEPDISYIINVTTEISKYLKKGQLVVLESTTYPGTTEEVLVPILEKSGLKAGEDFYVAFSPERVDPGNKNFTTKDIPKVVGGINEVSTEKAMKLYSIIIPKIHKVSSPRVAEMEKLLENIFRLVNISFINELAILCRKMNIDIWEVISAASTKPYGFMPFYPGPGLGGHCIPIDPFYLSWKAKEYDFDVRFIELAGEINDNMPRYVVQLVMEALNRDKKAVNGSKILIIGVAYKPNIADPRESPALKIIPLLEDLGGEVEFYDPYVSEIKIENSKTKEVKYMKSCVLDEGKVKNADCVLIVTDHDNIDYEMIYKNAKLIVDTRNALRKRGISIDERVILL
ncbi:MAG: UDP-N-acetyl-D-glucosamine dehydrogenase [Dictyoglomus turgidum]|nr:MAG: UDP-N-acetyl-D-glucosamine dehydrogenase [Dictyoglomus turgidum]PNV80074.1 MAG: UDP-N-acetyl-D-glucosamine dehydrogenase [Dictyoglomus turgidum]